MSFERLCYDSAIHDFNDFAPFFIDFFIKSILQRQISSSTAHPIFPPVPGPRTNFANSDISRSSAILLASVSCLSIFCPIFIIYLFIAIIKRCRCICCVCASKLFRNIMKKIRVNFHVSSKCFHATCLSKSYAFSFNIVSVFGVFVPKRMMMEKFP